MQTLYAYSGRHVAELRRGLAVKCTTSSRGELDVAPGSSTMTGAVRSLRSLSHSQDRLRGRLQSAAHFSRMFKSAYGVSPRDYRIERPMIA